jgi:hypothetical protein
MATDASDDFSAKDLRAANGYWSWLRDKPLGEREAAREILTATGYRVDLLVSRKRGEDLPDCEGCVDGRPAGIEVVELVHQKALERSLKGSPSYFQWDRSSFLQVVAATVARKSDSRWLGGPYDLRVLAIHTDELALDREVVARFLVDQQIDTGSFGLVVLGLSYDPAIQRCPTFILSRQSPRPE